MTVDGNYLSFVHIFDSVHQVKKLHLSIKLS